MGSAAVERLMPPICSRALTIPEYPDRNEIAMGKLNVKNGTPVGNEHLCRICKWGQFTTGYRESDVLVVCGNSNPARSVPFVVRECTDFWDRNRLAYLEMTKLALNFSSARSKPIRGFDGTGFSVVPTKTEEREDAKEDDEEEDDEMEDEAASSN
jgi:hypothetical protein